MTAITTPTPTLAELETVIKFGMEQFLAVGNALLAIKLGELYKQVCPTWGQYLETRWGMQPQRAHQLMDASRIADTVTGHELNESQYRALKGVNEALRDMVVTIAVNASKQAETPLSASTITRTVQALQEFQQTGAVTIDSEQVPLIDLLTDNVANEVKEARNRQRARMDEKSHTRLVGTYSITASEGQPFTLDLDAGQYKIIVYATLGG